MTRRHARKQHQTLRTPPARSKATSQRPPPPPPPPPTTRRQVAFSKIKEIRAVPRALGAWGDMVIFLKDGSRLELVGMQNWEDIKRHIESCIVD